MNPHDSEVMLNRILKHLISAEDKGMLAMEFFNHNPKMHAKKQLKELPNETVKNIFKYIYQHFVLLIGIFCFLKGFIGFFIGGDSNYLYLYTFPITVIIGLFIIFLFIWMIFKTIQLQCFNNSNWVWLLTYAVIALLIVALFYVFFIPQSFLAFGPFINVSNWSFIIISIIITPISFYIDHHYFNKDANTIM